jgi:predicted transcriptional regulator of viral defense system
MKPEEPATKARQYVDGLAASGRHFFELSDARKALSVSHAAAKMALLRLSKQGVITSPARGFYAVVPPEYRSLGCLPAEQFVPALMAALGVKYYAGLLTAAQYHGAAHQRPQAFQVLLERPRLPIACGNVRVAFVTRRRLSDVPVQSVNTPRGFLVVSTPEATALDLVGYVHRVGGLDNVATVLSELAAKLDPGKLAAAATTAPVPWAQRLGYLMDLVGASGKAAPLRNHVRQRARESVPLLVNTLGSSGPRSVPRSGEWKLFINARVEPEL